MADYGAFVEISPGVEGLIHVSEMSWSQHLRSAQDFLKVGDPVDAQILTLDREDRKMSLGIKQLKDDPWAEIETKYGTSSQHTAKVRNFTNFGVFVEIEEGVDGLIHISDLSWTKKIKHPSEYTQIGDDINVMVLEIDKDNRRLSLGHKQLEENPWDVFETIFTIDSVHEGTVVDIFDKGAIVALPYGVEGFVTPKHMVKENGTPAKIDEKLNFKILEFSKSSTRIILSHSRTFEDPKKSEIPPVKPRSESDETKIAAKKLQDSLEKTTFGDIGALSALKEEMEATEKKKVVKRKTKAGAADKAESEVAEVPTEQVEKSVEQSEVSVEQPEIVEVTTEVAEVSETKLEESIETETVVDAGADVEAVIEAKEEPAVAVESEVAVDSESSESKEV
jgi:small subunit ribosomal protein S1